MSPAQYEGILGSAVHLPSPKQVMELVGIERRSRAAVALGGTSTTLDHFRTKSSELVPTGSPPIHHGRERAAPFLTCSAPRERS